MRCATCQVENAEGSAFCSVCGRPLQIACPCCYHPNPTANKFCGQCGFDLTDAGQAARPGDGHSDADPMSSGERRQATVMFADVCSYTALTEQSDPEDVDAVVNRLKEIASSVVEKHQGMINQFVGDEALVVFGLPHAQEDDPVRAVRAALELHAEVRASSLAFAMRVGRPLALHTGINTGLVVAQRSKRREGLFSLTGDAVNVAARLRSEAKEDEILIGPNTQRLVRPYFELASRPAVLVKGKALPIIPYQVLAESKIGSRFDAARTRGFTGYVGRYRELEMIQACLARARAGEGGSVVTIEGDTGVGKSRLLYEFLRGIDREETSVPQGRCQAQSSDIPYFPFIDGLRRGLQLTEDDSHKEALAKAVTNIRLVDPDLESRLPLFLHLLAIPSEYRLPAELKGDSLRKAMEEALVAILTRTARLVPTVLVLEDWHWSDPASRSALQRLCPVVGDHRLVVAVTYRTGYGVDLHDLPHHTDIRLNPLSEPETENLVKNVMGAEVLPAGLTAAIHRSTEGNPLFVEESCFSLIESQSISVDEGRAIMHRPPEELLLPDTVQAVIRARLDRLHHEAKQLVGIASVVGRSFSERILAHVCGGRSFQSALHTLQTQEIIRPTKALPDPEYTFRHILAREVAYDALLNQQRKKLHEDVAAAIETIHSDRLDQYAAILAHHYARSARADKAIEYSLLAGDQAAQIYAQHRSTDAL
jgi:class 3 adenylate cyclase